MGEPQRVNPEWEVGVEDIAARLRAGGRDLVLIDCRTVEERMLASIDGSLHIPLDEIPARLGEIEALEDEGEVVVYCHAGVRSMHAAVFLREQGIDSARSMAGGIDAWSVRVDPGVERY